MVFLGNSFFSGQKSLRTTPTNTVELVNVKIENGIYDELYITKNTDLTYSTAITSEWDYNTILHAFFNGTLFAGNVNYMLSQVNSIRVKRRITNTYEWTTLFEVPITKESDLRFTRYDRFAQSGIVYDYASIPVLNNVEGNISSTSVLSEFEGVFIVGKDQTFNTILKTGIVSQKNRPSSIVTTIGRKRPYVISNGTTNYYSGTTTGMFLETESDNLTWKYTDGWTHRKELMEFLCDGKPKILKYYDGRIWFVSITGSPSEATQDQNDIVITSFEWNETYDYNSTNDLYNSGLIDVNIEGR